MTLDYYWSSCLHLLSAGITDMSHHAWPIQCCRSNPMPQACEANTSAPTKNNCQFVLYFHSLCLIHQLGYSRKKNYVIYLSPTPQPPSPSHSAQKCDSCWNCHTGGLGVWALEASRHALLPMCFPYAFCPTQPLALMRHTLLPSSFPFHLKVSSVRKPFSGLEESSGHFGKDSCISKYNYYTKNITAREI